MKNVFFIALFLFAFSCSSPTKKDHQLIEVSKAPKKPVIDGKDLDACWGNAKWLALDQLWLGEAYDLEDFNGRYKLSWDEDGIYALVEITDDVLFDQNKDPFTKWWDDDCLEIFVDEDNSGGNHQFNHNAFAYHIALDGNIVDLSTDEKPRLYNDNVISKRLTQGNTSIWEVAIVPFGEDFQEGRANMPKKLSRNKRIGFALAYCDNDGSEERENFIGSVFVPGEDKNQGWIEADVFGTLVLDD